jgi:hypothetical protein
MVQVRLPSTTNWSYLPAQGSGPLIPEQPSGILIHSLNACVWSFQAVTSGKQMLPFSGQAIYKVGQPCPNYRIALTFSVSVS